MTHLVVRNLCMKNLCSTTSASYKQRSLRFLSGTILVVFHRKHLAATRTAGKLLPLSQIDNVSDPQLAYPENIQIWEHQLCTYTHHNRFDVHKCNLCDV